MQRAGHCLQVDIENIVGKMHQYEHIYTVPVQTLKDICDFVDMEIKYVLVHTKT
jgi:hypothetical protein